MIKPWQTKEWLEREYITHRRTTQDIAKEVKTTSGTVYYWVKKLSLQPRKNYDESRARFDLLKNKDWLRQRYLGDAVSIKVLARETGVSYKTARKYLLLHDIELHKKHVCLTKPAFDRPTGSKSPSWKGGRPKCVDCGERVAGRPKGTSPRCAVCKSKFYRGSNHHSWRPDKSPSSYVNAVRRSAEYRDWRKAVYVRDAYTCQICGRRGGHLHAHHLNSFTAFPDLRYELANGVTLCSEHHIQFHRQFGMGGNTAEQFRTFATNAAIPPTTT